jgi:hypothetical protein
MKRIQLLVLTGVSALFMGCATSRPFESGGAGKKEASAKYEIRTGQGDFGMVHINLRTTGVRNTGTKDAPQNRVTIQMDVANDSTKSVALDPAPLSVQLIVSGKKQDVKILPNPVPPAAEIPGQSKKTLALEFPLPASVKPSTVSGFELAWGLVLSNDRYTQVTGFGRDVGSTGDYTSYDPVAHPYGSVSFSGGSGRSRTGVNFGIGFGF